MHQNPLLQQLSGQLWTNVLLDQLYVPDQKHYVRVRQSDILYVKGARSSVELALMSGGSRIVSTYLSQFMVYLNPNLFVQVSRSYVVNLLYVNSLRPVSIDVNNHIIPVTPAYRDSIRQRLTLVRLRPEIESPDSP